MTLISKRIRHSRRIWNKSARVICEND